MAQRIYTASDQLLVSHLYTLLEKAGISALTQKSAVDVPSGESGPLVWHSELWIMKDCELAIAQLLLEQALASELRDLPHKDLAGTSFSPPAEIA
ncbi:MULTISPECIES: hypothetical protein [unclassified Microbulbifer]|uniref:hypothetical protein n=1 Tax=unclassified Microbulbifer TaxID=2619833 RepID=UPI0027E406CF|nr:MULTISPECIES: hypothetical protein [unclassified Microbulbifer]